jgi:ABC-2 type transport system ATP-binding protein
MPAVLADGLVKHYSGRDGTVEAVRGVDLEVPAGEMFGFLGPNGARKSTTVRMLTTLLTITSGRAEVAGIEITRYPDEARRRIGVALQEARLDPRQSGRELLLLHGRLFGLGAAAAKERAEQLLALVELEEAADRTIKGYSGGMQRPARPGRRARPRARGALPRRAHHGLGPVSRLTSGRSFAASTRTARRSSSRPSTSRRPTGSATGSRSSTSGCIVRAGAPAELKADLQSRTGADELPTLDDVFLDATGRTRERVAGEVQEVIA